MPPQTFGYRPLFGALVSLLTGLTLLLFSFPAVTESQVASGGIHGEIYVSLRQPDGQTAPVHIPDLIVKLRGPTSATTTRTDVYGRYVFDGLPAATYTVTWCNPGWEGSACSTDVTVADRIEHQPPTRVSPTNPDTLRWGRIRFSDGASPWFRDTRFQQPVEQTVTVTLLDAAGARLSAPILTNAWGEFVMADSAAARAVAVTLGKLASTVYPIDGDSPQFIELKKGTPSIRAVNVRQEGSYTNRLARPFFSLSSRLSMEVIFEEAAYNIEYLDNNCSTEQWQGSGGSRVWLNPPNPCNHAAWQLPPGVGWYRVDFLTHKADGTYDQARAIIESSSATGLPSSLVPPGVPRPYEYLTRKGGVEPYWDPLLLDTCWYSCWPDLVETYYAAVDPYERRTTLGSWWAINGFDPATGLGGTRIGYQNYNDLGFGRNMNCLQRGEDVACYVANYGQPHEEDEHNAWLAHQADPSQAVGTVAMEYRMVEGKEGLGRVVKFFAFGGAMPEDARVVSVSLERSIGAPEGKYLPYLCLNCHGGDYTGTIDLKANFLPFDTRSFKYPGDCQQMDDLDCTVRVDEPNAEQAAVFRELNRMVMATQPLTAIQDLIVGWYGTDMASLFQDAAYVPAQWDQDAADREFYRAVISPSCRTCHIASRRNPFAGSQADFHPHAVRRVVCGPDKAMPHSLVTHRKFLTSTNPVQPEVLAQYLGIPECK